MPITLTFRVVLLSVVVTVSGLLRAATATNAAAAPPVTTPAAPPVSTPKGVGSTPAPQVPGHIEDHAGYDAAGRRDPFVNLLSRGETRLPVGQRPVGVTGLLIGELSVRGVMHTNGTLLAIVQAPDNKSYTLHSGDALFDGTVKVVASDAVIFLQRVDDPLSAVKQREIRKSLRTTEANR